MSQDVSGGEITSSTSQRAVLAVPSIRISHWPTRASHHLRGAMEASFQWKPEHEEEKCGRVIT